MHPSDTRRKRPRLSPDSMKNILKIFGLKEEPKEIAYADPTRTWLRLPSTLTHREIREIAVACRKFTASFCLGDLLVWLDHHPDAPFTSVEIRDLVVEADAQGSTIDNYKSTAKNIRWNERFTDLVYGYHEAVAALKFPRDRKRLLRQARKERIPIGEFRDMATTLKNKQEMGRSAPQDIRRRRLFDVSEKARVFSRGVQRATRRGEITEADQETLDKALAELTAQWEEFLKPPRK